MTTYTKEYSDTSHVWMVSAIEYATMLHTNGLTFTDLMEQRPHLANSQWGHDVSLELDLLKPWISAH